MDSYVNYNETILFKIYYENNKKNLSTKAKRKTETDEKYQLFLDVTMLQVCQPINSPKG